MTQHIFFLPHKFAKLKIIPAVGTLLAQIIPVGILVEIPVGTMVAQIIPVGTLVAQIIPVSATDFLVSSKDERFVSRYIANAIYCII